VDDVKKLNEMIADAAGDDSRVEELKKI